MTVTELQYELDETLRKIGRNVLLFQKIEALLKHLVSNANIEGATVKELKNNHRKKINSVSQKTMGILAKDLFTSVYSDQNNESVTPQRAGEDIFKFSFTIDADPEFVEQRRLALEHIVTERNTLIHQTLSSFDFTSIESCRALNAVLDEQADRIKSEFENIRTLVLAMQEVSNLAIDAIANENCTTKNEN